MSSLDKVQEKLSSLARGERYVYHEGLLARDRTHSFFLNAIAELVYTASRRNRVILTQRRVALDHYQYIAIGR